MCRLFSLLAFVPFDEIVLHSDQAGGGAWFGVEQAEFDHRIDQFGVVDKIFKFYSMNLIQQFSGMLPCLTIFLVILFF